MKSEPLNDADLETWSGVLKKFGSNNAMDVEQLDGFLTALTCCPISISPREYLPLIWGDEMINEDAFAAQPILRESLALVARHKTAIRSTLQSTQVFTPLLMANEEWRVSGQ